MNHRCYDTEQLIRAAGEHMKSGKNRVGSAIPAASNKVTWVQTERATHEAWGKLTTRSPRAAAMAHFLVANMERSGAVVASYATLSKITGMSVATVRRAIADLKTDRWLEVVQIGGKGGANAFIINSRVAWAEGRNKLHLAGFTARVIADKAEQAALDNTPLRRFPMIMQGESQLPTGPGEDPPSQPSIPGMEPDLPYIDAETGEVMNPDMQTRMALEKRGQQRIPE